MTTRDITVGVGQTVSAGLRILNIGSGGMVSLVSLATPRQVGR
ncbi:MAG TPA: hypothetical protein VF669_08385 [Tepidisphaeraceae bacterium]